LAGRLLALLENIRQGGRGGREGRGGRILTNVNTLAYFDTSKIMVVGKARSLPYSGAPERPYP
jgi:hypothetical protein